MKQRLHELSLAGATNDLSGQLNALKAVADKSKGGYHDFVSGLSEAQHTGLKKSLQRLGKTSNELVKAVAMAIQEFGRANTGAKRAAKLAKVQTAVQNLLNEQDNIAVEMGISH